MPPKEPKQPSVNERLEVIERLLARADREAQGQDPLSLVDVRPEDVLVQEKEAGDFREALKRVEVRRTLYRLMKLGGLMDSDSDPNATIMAHHAGRRSLALDLYNAIKKVDASAFHQMEREHESDLKSKEKENGPA